MALLEVSGRALSSLMITTPSSPHFSKEHPVCHVSELLQICENLRKDETPQPLGGRGRPSGSCSGWLPFKPRVHGDPEETGPGPTLLDATRRLPWPPPLPLAGGSSGLTSSHAASATLARTPGTRWMERRGRHWPGRQNLGTMGWLTLPGAAKATGSP